MPESTQPRPMWNHAPVSLPPRPVDAPPPPVKDERPPDETNTIQNPGSPVGSAAERLLKSATGMLVFFIFFYVVVRLVFLAHDALELPYVLKCLVLILLSEFAAILVWLSWKGWRLYRSLPSAFDQVSRKKISASKGGKVDEEIQRILYPYVNDHRLSAPKSEDDIAAKLLDQLRNPDQTYNGDSGTWVKDFKNFQDRQDEAACEIVKTAAKRIAAATVVTRWSVVDMASTLYLSADMIANIAQVYNRRISVRQSFWLALEWAAGIAFSGKAGQIGEMVGRRVSKILSTFLSEQFGEATIAGTIGNFLGFAVGFASGKLAEGAANAFLALKLGKRAIHDFRAMADE